MPNIVFEHLKEHINLIYLRENKLWPFNIDVMSTRWKNLKSLGNPFPSVPSVATDDRISFSEVI